VYGEELVYIEAPRKLNGKAQYKLKGVGWVDVVEGCPSI
jgi:hypothetical protein